MCKNREERSWHEMEFRCYRGESSNYIFEVFMAVKVHIMILCSLIHGYQRFGSICFLCLEAEGTSTLKIYVTTYQPI
jgi:hypothetical protein